MDELHFSVANSADGYEQATQILGQRLTAWDVSERVRYIVELALEEMLTNIIRYGFPEAGTHSIDIRLELEGHAVRLTFKDDGRAFDPTERDASAAGGGIEVATVGGRGILMIRKLARSMRYERQDGRNVLELVIDREAPSAEALTPTAT
jgi:anti-sigma regulatory factor (Ser/Thr protein kinase)